MQKIGGNGGGGVNQFGPWLCAEDISRQILGDNGGDFKKNNGEEGGRREGREAGWKAQ